MIKTSHPHTNPPAATDPPRVLVNGRACPNIEIADRGLAYGDGVFETIAIANRRPEFWNHHLERLEQGCRILKIPSPDPDKLAQQTAILCADMPVTEPPSQAIVKIIVTRGAGGRGYAPPPKPTPTIICARYDWPPHACAWSSEGVAVRLCRTRFGHQPALAGIKHLNRLENVLARAEWQDPEIAEGLICDHQDRLIEGVMSNLFLFDGQRWATPDLKNCGIAGVMRRVILDLAAKQGREMVIRPIERAELQKAEGLFLSNSIIGIWPVRQVAGRPMPLHPSLADLQTALREHRRAEYSDL